MEKRGLGRGLAALIPEAPELDDGSQVREIPTDQIVPNPYQPRTLFDPLKMEELVASVKEHGILQPVLVRRVGHERYQLVAGERRFRAAQAAGLLLVPALVREIAEREQLEMAVVENVQREDIGVMEAARAYRRLIDEFDMTQDTVARRVGKSRSSIANTLRLLDLPEPVQESVERGELSEGHARALLMARDEAAILRAWQRVVKNLGGRLSVRETEKLAKEMLNADLRASGSVSGLQADSRDGQQRSTGEREGDGLGTDPNEMAAADRLQEALGTKVSIRHAAGGTGRIEIEFYSRQDLQRLVELLLSEKEEA
jgi:ParB family chromosome partitioning protein